MRNRNMFRNIGRMMGKRFPMRGRFGIAQRAETATMQDEVIVAEQSNNVREASDRGQGQGRGQGFGRGQGQGQGQGFGRGQGQGRGQGSGRGQGQGRCQGQARGKMQRSGAQKSI